MAEQGRTTPQRERELDPSPETELEGRQPYHWPRGPEVATTEERRGRLVWMAVTAVLFVAVVALVVFIASYEG